ncbi:MAG: hypothetical protein E6G51_01370 [Actinobacteria bacterium]|nr:MAG: hypothetical protein E6G51_01370 [Actinomycetota bacterium]
MESGSSGLRVALIAAAAALLCALGFAASADAAVLSGTVSGQAPGEEAKPLPETVVSIFAGEERLESTTDAKGAYSLEVPDGVYDVRFDPPPGYEAITVHAVDVTGSRALNVVLTNATTVRLTGALLTADGDPVPDASVWLTAGGKSSFGERTDENGRFHIAALPGTYTLHVEKFEGTDPELPESFSFEVPSLALESDRDLGELRLPATTTLTIQVLDANDSPLFRAGVTMPPLVRQAEIGGLLASELTSGGSSNPNLGGLTNSEGRVSFVVFGGTVAPYGKPEVVPQPTSGYARTAFTVPPVEGETTVVVRFTKEGEEEPEPKDTTGPELKEFGIEPTSIDTSSSAQEVLVRAHIADDLSGFAAGTVTFTSPSGEQTISSSEFKRWNGSAVAGDYEIPVVFAEDSEPGDWVVTKMVLRDAAGNETILGTAQIEELGFPPRVHVEQPPSFAAEVTLKSNPNPVQLGNKVTFTARVIPLDIAAPAPGGTVVFLEGSSPLAVVALNEGKASFSTSALGLDTHTITAHYSGDANFSPADSKSVSQVVTPRKGGH